MNAQTAQFRQGQPGKVKEITALTNPVIKQIRGLALKKNRDGEQLFLAEGLKLVTDALEGNWHIEFVLYAKRAASENAVQAVAAQARARGALIIETSEKVLGAVSRRDNPQTVVGVVRQRWRDASEIRPHGEEFWIALDRVRDPGNLGTILRTADCVGAKGALLIGNCTDPWAVEAVRASMGSIFHVELVRLDEKAFIAWRGEWPGIVVGTHLKGAIDYREPEFAGRPLLLLMGNEQQGLSEELARTCDTLCRIPMAGQADSLNLAVSTGVMAFEMRRHLLKLDADEVHDA